MSYTMHRVDNGDGWELAFKQCHPVAGTTTGRSPLLLIPGYGMNSFPLGYHPSGQSLEQTLCARGFEVWSCNLRGQDPSRSIGGSKLYGIRDLALVDLPRAIDYALANTRSGASELSLIGCSLGGTTAMTYLALWEDPRVKALVNVGGPLRWVEIHPLLRFVFSCPELVGMVPMMGTRTLAAFALPLLARFPALLHMYMHPEIIDMDQAHEFVNTVSDPNRQLNMEMAYWFKSRDLFIDGTNVSEAFAGFDRPLLTVVSNADGIVPAATARYPVEIAKSPKAEVLYVGTNDIRFAHADLYISNHAHEHFFEPMLEWLESIEPLPAAKKAPAKKAAAAKAPAKKAPAKKAPAKKAPEKKASAKK